MWQGLDFGGAAYPWAGGGGQSDPPVASWIEVMSRSCGDEPLPGHTNREVFSCIVWQWIVPRVCQPGSFQPRIVTRLSQGIPTGKGLWQGLDFGGAVISWAYQPGQGMPPFASSHLLETLNIVDATMS